MRNVGNTISISGYHIREAGSTAAQEVAFTLANGLTAYQFP
nr:methylmalonyl-CoA mutase family protein [Candidatus Electrothrix aestuarii]